MRDKTDTGLGASVVKSKTAVTSKSKKNDSKLQKKDTGIDDMFVGLGDIPQYALEKQMMEMKTEEEIEKFERMRHRDKRKSFMFYPEDQAKANWDLFITVVLIFTCLSTPYRIAFIDKDNTTWIVLNYSIDLLFLVDIIFIFCTAYNDDDFTIIDDRKQIARGYIYSWFSIDFLAIVPFDQLI